jgi:hypothetical protein
MMAKHEAKPESAVIPPPPKADWLDLPPRPDGMGGFPFDGSPVMLTPDGVASAVAMWRQTNSFDKTQRKPRWVRSAFWARRDCVNQPIDFEPLGYREIVE